jgi:hypothetical protein
LLDPRLEVFGNLVREGRERENQHHILRRRRRRVHYKDDI